MRKTPAFWSGFVGGEFRQKFYTQYRKIQVYSPENDLGAFLANFPTLRRAAHCLHFQLTVSAGPWGTKVPGG